MARCIWTRDERQCKASAMHGATVCVAHGAKAPQVKAAAAVRVLEEKALKMVPESSEPIPDPIRRLLEIAAEADAFRAAVAELVNGLVDIRYDGDKAGEQLRSEIVVYERALDRVGRLLVEIVKLGLEERLVRVRESEARALAEALDGALTLAGISVEQAQTVKRETARALRLVA